MTQRNEKNNVVHVDQGLDKHGSYEIYSTNKTLYTIFARAVELYHPPPPLFLRVIEGWNGDQSPK